MPLCRFGSQYFNSERELCGNCSRCSACQVKAQRFCEECPKCQKACDIFAITEADQSSLSLSSPRIEFDLRFLRLKYANQGVPVEFTRLQQTVFKLSISNSAKETSVDFELELPASSISRADCKVPPDLRVRVRLARLERKIIKLSLKGLKYIVRSIESVSILSYFKLNFAFILIDFANKNKLFTYAFGLNPYKTAFTANLNLFVVSNNYLKCDALLSLALGLGDQTRAREYAAIRVHSGQHINEHLFEEIEPLDLMDLILCLLILLNRALFALATRFIRAVSLRLGLSSPKRLTQK